MPDLRTLFRSPAFLGLLLVLGLGIWLRLPEQKHRQWKGADEGYYERYVTQMDDVGLLGWPKLISGYIERQTAEPYAFLPPTRVLFLSSAQLWRTVTGTPAL